MGVVCLPILNAYGVCYGAIRHQRFANIKRLRRMFLKIRHRGGDVECIRCITEGLSMFPYVLFFALSSFQCHL